VTYLQPGEKKGGKGGGLPHKFLPSRRGEKGPYRGKVFLLFSEREKEKGDFANFPTPTRPRRRGKERAFCFSCFPDERGRVGNGRLSLLRGPCQEGGGSRIHLLSVRGKEKEGKRSQRASFFGRAVWGGKEEGLSYLLLLTRNRGVGKNGGVYWHL